jgi:hypothetical protein
VEEEHDLYLCLRDAFLEFKRNYWDTYQFFSDCQRSEHMRSALEALWLTRLEIPPAATPARIRLGLQSLETIRALTSYPRTLKIAWTWIGSPFLALLLAVGDI